MITIICAVAAEFPNPNKGEKPYLITRRDLNLIKEAPDWIEKTTMFKLLAADGSLKAVTSVNRVVAENNPTVGLGADGKNMDAPQKPAKGRGRAAGKKNESAVQKEAEGAETAQKEGKDAE